MSRWTTRDGRYLLADSTPGLDACSTSAPEELPASSRFRISTGSTFRLNSRRRPAPLHLSRSAGQSPVGSCCATISGSLLGVRRPTEGSDLHALCPRHRAPHPRRDLVKDALSFFHRASHLPSQGGAGASEAAAAAAAAAAAPAQEHATSPGRAAYGAEPGAASSQQQPQRQLQEQLQQQQLEQKQLSRQQQHPQQQQQEARGPHSPLPSALGQAAAAAAAAAAHDTSLDPLKMLFAGALSAIIARTCTAPLERIKMDLVLGRNAGGGGVLGAASRVMKAEGLAGFWHGNVLNLARTAPFKAVNFLTFDTLHHLFVVLAGRDGNAQRFVAGALAGISATLLCFPLDVLRTRMLAPGALRYGGTMSTLAGVIRHEGFGALYAGVGPALVAMAPSGAVFYGVYDLLKSRHLARLDLEHPEASPHHTLPAGPTMLYGALSGACAELVVYPLEILRRRMQLLSMATAAGSLAAASRPLMSSAPLAAMHLLAWAKVTEAAAAIVRANGLGGFYTGLVPNIMQVIPASALGYLTYDRTKTLLGVTS